MDIAGILSRPLYWLAGKIFSIWARPAVLPDEPREILNPADAEAQFQLATALSYMDRETESDEHYKLALELRSGTPAPEQHEQGRLLAVELIQEVDEARSFFHEVTRARDAALAELPRIPWVFWSRIGLLE